MILLRTITAFKLGKKLVALISCLLFFTSSFAQKGLGTIKGSLVNAGTSQPVTGATISVVAAADTSVKFFSISSGNGTFEINGLLPGRYLFSVSHQGLETIKKQLSLSGEKSTFSVGILKMATSYKTLSEVVVKDEAAVRIKGDTLVYKADAFKTRPDATVEDLLKKLPGVQVDKNGAAKAQGEQVQKVYVDGKEFFSNDPKLATKNLTADMIDQVQVFNDMSEQSKFNGIDDGSRTKAINLKLKKEKKTGTFGKAYAGYGPGHHYDAGITANYFKGASQLSFLAATNNINKMGYTPSNMGSPAGGKGFNRSRSGLTKTSSIGVNYRDTWSKSLDGNGSYFFNRNHTNNLWKSERQTFLRDSTLFSNRETENDYLNKEHRFNFRLVYLIDSLNSLIYIPTLTLQQSHTNNNDTLTDYITTKVHKYKGIENRTLNSHTGQGHSWTNNLVWRRKFSRRGRTLSASLSGTTNYSQRAGHTSIRARLYNNRGELYRERASDYKTEDNGQAGYTALSVSYTEPLSSSKLLELNYHYNRNKNTSDRRAYNYNPVTGKYDAAEDSLTNSFENLNKFTQVGANLRGVKEKYQYQAGFAVQRVSMHGNNQNKNLAGEQYYTNLLPAASFNFRFTRSKHLQLAYRTRSNQPAITQLQDITDLSSYPFIRKGNPDLKQEFVHSLVLTYNGFNTHKQQNVFVSLFYNNTRNKIVSSIVHQGGEQIMMPTNINGVFNVVSNLSIGLPLDKTAGGNLNVTTLADYSHDAVLVNGVLNFSRNYTLGEELSLSNTFKEKLDVDFTASISYNAISYTGEQAERSSYLTHIYTCDLTYPLPKSLLFTTSLDYTGFSGRTEAFNRDYVMWNINLSKPILKNKRGVLTLSVHDLLNQNQNVSRRVYDNVIEDIENQTQKRFALLTFTYNFSKLKGK